MDLAIAEQSFFAPTQKAGQLVEKETVTKAFEGFDMLGPGGSKLNITVKDTLSIECAYACIRDKSESIGQCGVNLYRKDGANGELEQVHSGREYRIFTQKPNEFQTMQDFIETFVTCAETYGRFYAYIRRNKLNSVSEIIPFRYQMNVGTQMDQQGRVFFTYTTNDGKTGLAFTGQEILSIHLNSIDGYNGISPIAAGSRALNMAINQEEHLSNLMENGAMPRGILTTDMVFKDENAVRRLQEQWVDNYGGAKNSAKTPILENNLKYQAMSISPADTELIKQRQYSREQICSLFRVPPSRIGIGDAKYNNLEESNISYMRDSLMPLIKKFENNINLILPKNLSVKIDEKDFIRGDRNSQVKAVGEEIKLGLCSINEARKDLGRNPVDGGDVHAIDTNNLTFGSLEEIAQLQSERREQEQLARESLQQSESDNEDDQDE